MANSVEAHKPRWTLYIVRKSQEQSYVISLANYFLVKACLTTFDQLYSQILRTEQATYVFPSFSHMRSLFKAMLKHMDPVFVIFEYHANGGPIDALCKIIEFTS